MASRLENINAICLHMPKTGSTWRETIFEKNAAALGLSQVADKHAPMAEVVLNISDKDMFRTQTHGYTFFTFVRHPADWLSSIWSDWIFPGRKENIAKNYANRGTWDNTFIAWPIANFFDPDSLDATILNMIEKYPDYVQYIYNSYTMGCNWVGRYESLKADMNEIFSQLQYKDKTVLASIESEPPLNVSTKREQSITDETREKLYHCAKNIYQHYGYEI